MLNRFNAAGAALMMVALYGCQTSQIGSSSYGGDLKGTARTAQQAPSLPANEAASLALDPAERKKQSVARRQASKPKTKSVNEARSSAVVPKAKVVSRTKKRSKKVLVQRKKLRKARKAPVSRRSASAAASKSKYRALVSKYARVHGVPVSLAHAVVRVESNYRSSARGRAGEVGLMQIKPATARGMGYRGSRKALFNPETNLNYGMKYLAGAYRKGGKTTCGTILKYNAGHGAKRMNKISRAYCGKVQRILKRG